jgi:hypothetical protein
MLAMDFIPSIANTILISDQLDNPPNKNPGLLDILLLELIFRILDFMEPHKDSGFSCTSWHAVTIVNEKLDNPKDKQELYSWLVRWYLDGSQAIRTQISHYKSLMARYVEKEKRDQLILQYQREMAESCYGYHPLGSEDDADPNQPDNTQTMVSTTLGLGSLPRELIFRILVSLFFLARSSTMCWE